MKNLKILMLNYEFPPLGGGASPVSYEIAKGYVGLGHDVSVVTMSFKGLKDFEIKDGIKIYRVPCIRKKKEICTVPEMFSYVISAKRFLKKHLKENKYDINHTHFIIPSGIVALWVKKKFDIPYIITSHGSDVPGFNTDRFKLAHYFTKPILKRVCEGAKLITTPSRYLADLVKKNIGNYSIMVLPNGSRDFYQKKIKKENYIVSVGRLLPRKGFQYLIKAFKNINPLDWKLYIIGDGPYKKELIDLANKDKKIIFTGWMDNTKKEFITILNKAKIFSLLSKSESQGIVFIEAMSAGCAILSSNITACKETVIKNIGYLVNIENQEEINKSLRRMIENRQVLKRMMNNSRKRYENSFRYWNIIKKYEGLLR